jgi:hypothetical protein
MATYDRLQLTRDIYDAPGSVAKDEPQDSRRPSTAGLARLHSGASIGCSA